MPSKSKKKRAAPQKTSNQGNVAPKPTQTANCSNANAKNANKQDVKGPPEVSVGRMTVPAANKSASAKYEPAAGVKKPESTKPQQNGFTLKPNGDTWNVIDDHQKVNIAVTKEKPAQKSYRMNNAERARKLSAATGKILKPQTVNKTTAASNDDMETPTTHDTDAEESRKKDEVIDQLTEELAKLRKSGAQDLETKVTALLAKIPISDQKMAIIKKFAGIQRMSIVQNKLEQLPKLVDMLKKLVEENVANLGTANTA